MKITKGTINDIEELEYLYNELNDYLACHINYPGWRKGIYPIREDAVCGIEQENLFVAKNEECIAGTVILNHVPEAAYAKVNWNIDLDYNDIFVVHTLAVHPRFLNMGLGNRLMDHIIEYSRNRNAKAIRLDVYEKNAPAISLYHKYDFQYIDTIDLGYKQYGLDQFELYQKLL